MADPKPAPRQVAGLWCDEVLGRLADYVDGALTLTDDFAPVDQLLATS